MFIRSEKPSDIEAIAEVTKAAFEDHPLSQQTEPAIIHDLRTDEALTISLVCEVEGRVVDHIVFRQLQFQMGHRTGMALARYLYCLNIKETE